MTNLNEILQDKIRLYDQENGTELTRFVAFLERGKVYKENEAKFFHVGKTGELLQKYGMKGDITIGKQAIDTRKHTHSKHIVNTEDWIKIILVINNPLAICKYTPEEKTFRLYTSVVLDGNVACVGVDVKKTRSNIEITRIKTAFWRDIEKVGNAETEKLIYPEP
ncbi:MAG: hypothetical protein J6W06_06930 [Bacteroidales bacterium]|nr:hypothetical protein [Bacteroidales bacterium]